MPDYLRVDETITPSPVQGSAGLRMLLEILRRRHPTGADCLLIGQSASLGQASGKARNGASVALAGLPVSLLNALQVPNSPDLQLLGGAVRKGGPVNVLMADGSVRGIMDRPTLSSLNYEEIKWA